MTTLEFIDARFPGLDYKQKPVEIPNTNRETLANLFAELGFSFGAEVGVERGLYAEVLCKANPNLFLNAVDSWLAYGGYRDHGTQQEMDEIYEEAKDRLKIYKGELIKDFSVPAAERFADESLDFVYIDANHEFQHVVNDIVAWDRKVKVGGIVAGHDYIKRRVQENTQEYLMHVIPAINGYTDAYNIKPLFVLGSKAKIEGQLRDSPRSWFYVKQAPLPIKPGWQPKA